MENLHRHADYLPVKKDPNEADQKTGNITVPGRECSLAAEDHRAIDDSDLSKFGVGFAAGHGLINHIALGADAEDEFGSRSFEFQLTYG